MRNDAARQLRVGPQLDGGARRPRRAQPVLHRPRPRGRERGCAPDGLSVILGNSDDVCRPRGGLSRPLRGAARAWHPDLAHRRGRPAPALDCGSAARRPSWSTGAASGWEQFSPWSVDDDLGRPARRETISSRPAADASLFYGRARSTSGRSSTARQARDGPWDEADGVTFETLPTPAASVADGRVRPATRSPPGCLEDRPRRGLRGQRSPSRWVCCRGSSRSRHPRAGGDRDHRLRRHRLRIGRGGAALVGAPAEPADG